MKKMRKIFAVLLTLAMVLGMSMTSFAADAKATITLTNFDKANKVEYMQIIQKDETKTSGWAFTNGAGACFTEAFGLKDSDDAQQQVIWGLIQYKDNTAITNQRRMPRRKVFTPVFFTSSRLIEAPIKNKEIIIPFFPSQLRCSFVSVIPGI